MARSDRHQLRGSSSRSAQPSNDQIGPKNCTIQRQATRTPAHRSHTAHLACLSPARLRARTSQLWSRLGDPSLFRPRPNMHVRHDPSTTTERPPQTSQARPQLTEVDPDPTCTKADHSTPNPSHSSSSLLASGSHDPSYHHEAFDTSNTYKLKELNSDNRSSQNELS